MLISVIVPLYNLENYIEKCINSFISQDFPAENYEIILVNDGSTDGSLQKIEQVQQKFPHHNIVVFTKNNGGPSSARNEGLKLATGRYIWFVDGDDWVTPDSFHKISITLSEYPQLDILEFNLIVATESFSGYTYTYPKDQISGSYGVTTGKKHLECYGYSLGVTVNLFKRDFLLSTGILFPLGKYSEDNIFSLQTLLKAEQYLKINSAFYNYYQRAESISHPRSQNNLSKYYNDIYNNLFEMREIVENESIKIRNSISEMIAYFQLLIFIGLLKQRKFGMAKQFATKMKHDGLAPVGNINNTVSLKFHYFRVFINMYYFTKIRNIKKFIN